MNGDNPARGWPEPQVLPVGARGGCAITLRRRTMTDQALDAAAAKLTDDGAARR